MTAFADLLHPYSCEQFLSEVWTQKSLFIGAGGHRKFADLFSWQTLNQLLNHHEFEYPTLRLALNGEVLAAAENQRFMQHCQAGATLILDRVHKLVPEISDFCGRLRYELGHPVQMNMYSSTPEKQGFRCHYDTHEVFILQVEGCKEWHVFNATVPYPLVDQKSAQLTPPETPPVLSCVLEPGDLLYIPRGHWHYAVALDQPSLHLTLGILCKTGIDYLEWLIEDLKQQEIWRENLPLLRDPDRAAQQIEWLLQRLSDDLQQGRFDHRQYFASLELPIANYAFPQQLGFQIFPQGIKTRFRRAHHQHFSAKALPDGFQITAGSKQIMLRGVPQQFVDQFSDQRLQHHAFTGSDVLNWLAGFDWETEIAPLLSRLVREGIILVDSPTKPAITPSDVADL